MRGSRNPHTQANPRRITSQTAADQKQLAQLSATLTKSGLMQSGIPPNAPVNPLHSGLLPVVDSDSNVLMNSISSDSTQYASMPSSPANSSSIIGMVVDPYTAATSTNNELLNANAEIQKVELLLEQCNDGIYGRDEEINRILKENE